MVRGGASDPDGRIRDCLYGKDRDRCALLCRSMREFAPSTDHWIVVDRADLGLFKSLRTPARRS